MTLTLTPLSDIPLIRPGDNLADIILNALRATDIELAVGRMTFRHSEVESCVRLD